MLDILRTAASLQIDLNQIPLPNCIIGGVALQAWGEPRLTRDIDITVLTNFSDEPEKAMKILSLVTPRTKHGIKFALENRVVLGYRDGTIPVDIALGGFDYEIRMVNRALDFEFLPKLTLRICSAEDLITMKVFAGRGQDWVDIQGILSRTPNLGWDLIERELPPLLEIIEAQDRLARLQLMRAEA